MLLQNDIFIFTNKYTLHRKYVYYYIGKPPRASEYTQFIIIIHKLLIVLLFKYLLFIYHIGVIQ